VSNDNTIKGLSTEQAKEKLVSHGSNILPEHKLPGPIKIFFRQFLSPLIYILLIAAAVSLWLDEKIDAAFIFFVLLANATIGMIQEYTAQKAASSLKKLVPIFTTVMRDGKTIRINSEELVPDDVVILEAGDKVPADLSLSFSQNLLVDESLLTGESTAVHKDSSAIVAEGAPVSEKLNMLFAGTIINRGRAEGLVVATGTKTQIGSIASVIGEESLAKPPLLIRIEKFTTAISIVMLAVIALLFIFTLAKGGNIAEVLILAIALAVAAVPEGLPASITVALSIGMRRMAKNNVIIRKLLAVESLGSCTFIASDKTGTLTVNELTIRRIILPGGEHFDVTGEGVNTEGKIISAGENKITPENVKNLCRAGVLANDASLYKINGEYKHSGDMVDVAFLVLTKKLDLEREKLLSSCPQVAAIAYESSNAYSASINQCKNADMIFVKGSAEKLLAMCKKAKTTEGEVPLDKLKIEKQVELLASQGYRILALAEGKADSNIKPDSQLHDLCFLGIVGMIDPLRSEAKEAVRLCKMAGIEVAMITGDHPVTAMAISRDLGIAGDGEEAIIGSQIKEALEKGDEAMDELVRGHHVFARVEPNQKKQIVAALMRIGHFVAVTGDGVNDAPALRHTNVGVAMGKRGTDVARESADMIITDDDFASIVKGIREGRIIYNNIRKVIFMLVSTGAAEIMLFIFAIGFGMPMPLLAVQLLWLNLVTEGFQHVALAFEPAEGDELNKPPRPPGESIFNRIMIERIVLFAVFIGATGFGVFSWMLSSGYSENEARNIILLLFVLFENTIALNSRSEIRSIFQVPFFSNPFLLWGVIAANVIHIIAMYTPFLQDLLNTSPVSAQGWVLCISLSLCLLVVENFYQRFRQWREKQAATITAL